MVGPKSIVRISALAVALALALTIGACGPKDPAEKVAKLRSFYAAELNGFLVLEPPPPDYTDVAPPEEGEGAADPEADAGDGEEGDEGAEDMEEAPAEPESIDVQLDILVKHRSPESLPGITLDITMVDGLKKAKGHWLWWVDTSGIAKATVTQFTHVLEDVSYELGDGFNVEVRHPVPADERGQYREFSSAP